MMFRYNMDCDDIHNWDIVGYPGEYVYGDDTCVDEYHMGERWLPIYGYLGYWISDHGRVYGLGRGGRGQFLKPVITGDGYYKVTLCCNGYHIDKRVNRLVAQAFLPNPLNLPLVMHLDNDRTNNRLDNLAWGTYEENNRWCWECGRHEVTMTDEIREKAYEARRTPILAINVKTGDTLRFISQREAARVLGVSQQHIWGVLNGYRRSTGGYVFEYCDEGDDYGRDY